jgi:hypothetical protein
MQLMHADVSFIVNPTVLEEIIMILKNAMNRFE